MLGHNRCCLFSI